MFELFAPFFHGSDSISQGPTVTATHYLFGSVKAHLGRVDLQIPDPTDLDGLAHLINSQQQPSVDGVVLSPPPSATPCTPAQCAVPGSQTVTGIPNSGVLTSEYGTGLGTGQTLVANPCMPATPMDPGAYPGRQYPGNSCAVFADEGLPPLVGFGYGGEWMDADVAESPSAPGEYTVFLADRGSCAVHAHRTMLADGEAVDVFPGYDPRETDPAYLASVWPQADAQGQFVPGPVDLAPFQESLLGYFPARNRVKGCRSVAVLPWPHLGVAGSVVASVGVNDPELALYMAPWEWLGARGRFVYDSTMSGTKVPVRFPFDAGASLDWSAKGDIGGVRTLDDFFLVFFSMDPGVQAVDSKDELPPDLAIVDPRPLTSTTQAEFLPGGTLSYTRVDFPRNEGKLTFDPGPPNFRILDARVSVGRVYLLGDDTVNKTFWLLTFDLVAVAGPSPGFVFQDALQLPTNYTTSEAQRVKVSPDGRWLVTTFGAADSGYLLMEVPETGGVLGVPKVVAGLRYDGTWQRLEPAPAGQPVAAGWSQILSAYSVDQRGQDGVTRAPIWPLPRLSQPPSLQSSEATQAAMSIHGASAEFFETANGTLLLSIDTDPISIWRIDVDLLTPAAASASPPGAPWLYVGALPSDGSGRQRLGWATPDGVFHLGDTGNWAWPACAPLRVPADICPVKP